VLSRCNTAARAGWARQSRHEPRGVQPGAESEEAQPAAHEGEQPPAASSAHTILVPKGSIGKSMYRKKRDEMDPGEAREKRRRRRSRSRERHRDRTRHRHRQEEGLGHRGAVEAGLQAEVGHDADGVQPGRISSSSPEGRGRAGSQEAAMGAADPAPQRSEVLKRPAKAAVSKKKPKKAKA